MPRVATIAASLGIAVLGYSVPTFGQTQTAVGDHPTNVSVTGDFNTTQVDQSKKYYQVNKNYYGMSPEYAAKFFSKLAEERDSKLSELLDQKLAQQNQAITDRDARISKLTELLSETDAKRSALDQAIAGLVEEKLRLVIELQNKTATLNNVCKSVAWGYLDEADFDSVGAYLEAAEDQSVVESMRRPSFGIGYEQASDRAAGLGGFGVSIRLSPYHVPIASSRGAGLVFDVVSHGHLGSGRFDGKSSFLFESGLSLGPKLRLGSSVPITIAAEYAADIIMVKDGKFRSSLVGAEGSLGIMLGPNTELSAIYRLDFLGVLYNNEKIVHHGQLAITFRAQPPDAAAAKEAGCHD